MASAPTARVYQPGVCNIGPAEIQSRRRFGWIGAVATIVIGVVLVLLPIPAPWRLFVILPAAGSASGFLQAGLHFCANFGMRGLFNVDKSVGDTESVMEADFRRADQRKATHILVFSALIGIVVGVIALVIP